MDYSLLLGVHIRSAGGYASSPLPTDKVCQSLSITLPHLRPRCQFQALCVDAGHSRKFGIPLLVEMESRAFIATCPR